MRNLLLFFSVLLLSSCDWKIPSRNEGIVEKDTLSLTDTGFAKMDSLLPVADSLPRDNAQNKDTAFLPPSKTIDVKAAGPDEVVNFAKTLVGIPYVYAASNRKVGFDCSGFITYVFNHFGISVPRSSVDFTNVGRSVLPETARSGDLILFTGTNPAERHVGHMGLVITNAPDSLQFIHSSSGKAMGVTITPLNPYYKTRFVKVIRIFP